MHRKGGCAGHFLRFVFWLDYTFFYVHHSYSLLCTSFIFSFFTSFPSIPLPFLSFLYLSFYFFTFSFISLPFPLCLYFFFTLSSIHPCISIYPSFYYILYLSFYACLFFPVCAYIYIHLSIFSILPPYLSLSIYPSILPSYLSFSIFQFVMSIASIITLYFYTIHLSIHLPYPWINL